MKLRKLTALAAASPEWQLTLELAADEMLASRPVRHVVADPGKSDPLVFAHEHSA